MWSTHHDHTLCALGCCLLRLVVCCVGANCCRCWCQLKIQIFLFHSRLLWTFYFSTFFFIRFEIVNAFVCDRNKFALKAERKIKQTVANFRGEDFFRFVFSLLKTIFSVFFVISFVSLVICLRVRLPWQALTFINIHQYIYAKEWGHSLGDLLFFIRLVLVSHSEDRLKVNEYFELKTATLIEKLNLETRMELGLDGIGKRELFRRISFFSSSIRYYISSGCCGNTSNTFNGSLA